MTHKLIELGKSYKLQMGRILLNMMADRGNICIDLLKRKILNGVDLSNKEVVGQIKRKSRRKSMMMSRKMSEIAGRKGSLRLGIRWGEKKKKASD